MKIVIEIDNKLYNRIKYLEPRANTMLDELMRSIQSGTPLPEHHTDLIERRCGNEACNGCEHFDICDIYNAPTIIEGSDE